MTLTADVIVIGGGMAGISAAAHLAEDQRVVVLERERHCGTQSTGRSAAVLIDDYGNATIRALTAASRGLYETADHEFWPSPLLSARGQLLVGRPGQEAEVAAQAGQLAGAETLSPAEALALVPILDQAKFTAAILVRSAADIDVDLLLQGYLKRLRRLGGRVETGAEVVGLERRGSGWQVRTGAADWSAPVIVNAAGAWADDLARLAGLPPLGLAPLRRSAAILPAPAGHDVTRWPLLEPIDEDWYAKPMGGKLMVSPADEDPVPPQDAWPDDMVLAEGIDRFMQMTTYEVTRIERSWAGLRSFVSDRTPVVGFDPLKEGFFWLAAQGGYGIQTAPALSRLAADLIRGRTTAATAFDLAALSPARLRGAA